jgi:flagellar biosynthesis protein FliQ
MRYDTMKNRFKTEAMLMLAVPVAILILGLILGLIVAYLKRHS